MQISATWTLLLTFQVSIYTALSQSSCYLGIADLQDYPLPNYEDVQYNDLGQQVIAPQLRFSCLGYISSWSGHVLTLTRPGFDLVRHVIILQVWRPGNGNKSYTRVGSNLLQFSRSTLRDETTLNPTTNDTAFFSFNREPVPLDEQILVQPGDVVGWLVPPLSPTPPLSPLFRDPISSDPSNVVGDIVFQNSTQEGCVICESEDHGVISSTVPLLSATVNSPSQDTTCTQMDPVCDFTTTPPNMTTPTNSSSPAPSSADEQLSTAESICVAISSATLILHAIMIILCAANLAVMTGIKRALKSRTVMPVSPGVRSPSTFNLGPIGGRKLGSPMASPDPYEMISSETPAPYEAVQPASTLRPPAVYETVPAQKRLQFEDENGSHNPLDNGNTYKQQSDNRTGSTEDLLDTGLD